MRLFFLLMLLCVLPVRERPLHAQIATHVVISEFATRGPEGNASGEFVECYNPVDEAVNISGWELQYRASTGSSYHTLVTVPQGTVMPAHSFFLFAGPTWAETPTADVQWSSSGIADNASLRIVMAGGVEVDRVGFGSGNDPEGSPAPHHGTTPNNDSVERKASAASTAASLAAGGAEEFAGNGWDSDDNAADFIVQINGRNPQNSKSGVEPMGADGSGVATIPETTLAAGMSFDLPVTFTPDPAYPVTALRIVLPPVFAWSASLDDVHLDDGLQATPSIRGDTLLLDPVVFIASVATITIRHLTAPARTGDYPVTVLTKGEQTFLPVRHSPIVSVRGGPIPIAEVKENTVSGIPLLLGETVTVTGIVTVADQFGAPGYIQDHSAGLAIYDHDFTGTVEIGDEVTLTGIVTQFNGLTELEQVTIDTISSTGNNVLPLTVTIEDVLTDGLAGYEAYEGRLLRINNVTVNTTAWMASGAGTNYKLSDGEREMDVRIDSDVPLAGQPAPGGSFDIIGVLSQYKSSAPFIGGYQLMPRLARDIVTAGPRLLSAAVECDIQPRRVDICWESMLPADGRVRYGWTEEFELGIVEGDHAALQRVSVIDLQPATIYCMQAFSVAEGDTSFARSMYVSTASATSTGEINVHFSRAVDNALYPPVHAHGSVPLAERLVERIDAARYSIDMCIYSLSGQVGDGIVDRLLAAKDRGVRIRAIFEADNAYSNAIRTLRSSVPSILDTYDRVNAGAGLQHNKFFVIDARDRTSDTDDWVITGSWNPTDPGTLADAQNVVEIQDQALALAYTREFEEMWGSDGDMPDSSKSRFGARKLDNTPHRFMIDGTPVELYFSPSDHTTNALLQVARNARQSVYFAVMTFTRNDLARTMVERNDAGVTVRGLMDNNTDQGTRFQYMQEGGVDLRLKKGFNGMLHHKYMIIDGDDQASDAKAVVATGSHNYTNAAENANNENTLLMYSRSIALQFLQEWYKRYIESGGTEAIVLGIEEHAVPSHSVLSVFPAPVRSGSVLTVQLHADVVGDMEVVIHDMLGRSRGTYALGAVSSGSRVLLLPTRTLQPGTYIVTARNARGPLCATRMIVW